jgi:hypothetical protein
MGLTGTLSRRGFFGRTAAGAATLGLSIVAPRILTHGVLAAPPSNRLSTGHIGVGGMGSGHLRGDGIAAADVSFPRAEAAARKMAKGCAVYQDYRRILDRKDIDAVIIATPDHWHALTSIHAMEAGKDIYCEKPASLTIQEGRAMVTAARRYGRVFQVGSQQRSGAEFIKAVELVRSGKIGKLKHILVCIGGGPTSTWEPDADPPAGLNWGFWLGPAPYVPYNPKRCFYTFRWFWDYSGGKMTDWGAHHNDIAQWGNNTEFTGPIEIDGRGRFPDDGPFETCTWFEVNYKYANGVTLRTQSDGPNGITFYGTTGEVFVSRGKISSRPADIVKRAIGPDDVRVRRARNGHKAEWEECIKTRELPNADIEIGHRSCTVCHLGNISIRLGRKLRWNPDTEQFVDDEEANRWLGRPMRPPWAL